MLLCYSHVLLSPGPPVAQLACLHFLVTPFLRFPGSIGGTPFGAVPIGVESIKVVPAAFWGISFLLAGIIEVATARRERWGGSPGVVRPGSKMRVPARLARACLIWFRAMGTT